MLYMVMLLVCRRAILDDKPTSLSSAIGFLVRSAAVGSNQAEPSSALLPSFLLTRARRVGEQ